MEKNRFNQHEERQNKTSVPSEAYWVAKHFCIEPKKKNKADIKEGRKNGRENFFDRFDESTNPKKVYIKFYNELIDRLEVTASWMIRNLRNNTVEYMILDMLENLLDKDFMKYFIKEIKDNLSRKDANKKYFTYAVLINRSSLSLKSKMEADGKEYDDTVDKEVIEILLPKAYVKAKKQYNLNPEFIRSMYTIFPNKAEWEDQRGLNSKFVGMRKLFYSLTLTDLFGQAITDYNEMVQEITDFMEQFMPKEHWVPFVRSALLEAHRFKYAVKENDKPHNTWTLIDDFVLSHMETWDKGTIKSFLQSYINARNGAEKQQHTNRRVDFKLLTTYPNICSVVSELTTITAQQSKEQVERNTTYLCL